LTDASEAESSETYDETYLVDYVKRLEQRIRGLEQERRAMETEYVRMERELRSLKSEFERLRAPPLVAGTLLDLLPDERAIVRSTAGPQFIVKISQFLDRENLKPGTRVALNQRTLNIVEVLPSKKDPLVLGMEIETAPSVTYENVGGLEEQIKEIKETVELPLLKPESFKRVGVEPPHGILLYGPPGTGKTLLARAVAHETKATFIRLIGSELVQKFIGEGARMVREMFELARERAPSIVFIDEVDAIAASRMSTSTSGDREVHRTMMQLLAELDGFDPRGDVKILAATNRPDILDRALLRPGRFDRLIRFPMPNDEARGTIFRIHTKGMNLSSDVDLDQLARITKEATGADIKSICTEAGMCAIREDREQITAADFQNAAAKVLAPVKERPRAETMFG